MHIIETQAYRKAFNQYLRKGPSIELSLKRISQESLHQKMLGNSTHYIWHTQVDAKVRPSHSANDERIFAWENPPATGHPGEDYGCRCWAEPIGDGGYANQILITSVNDGKKWSDLDFWNHYRDGNHAPVTLQEVGYLAQIINYYEHRAIASDEKLGVYRAVNEQIINEAIKTGEGYFNYPFGTTYNFYDVLYTFRNSTVKGNFEGDAREEKGFLVVNGVVTYNFSDEFADVLTLVEVQQRLGFTRRVAVDRVRFIDEALGDVYSITGTWQTKFNATLKIVQ